jgi:single-stranded-DNA-specific exonuclease
MHRRWRVRPVDAELENAFGKQLGVRTVTARVLAARGAQTLEAARLMLDASLGPLHSPWELPHMDVAVRRLTQAYAKGEKVSVYGDYDADGQTGAALVVLGLRRLGMEVDYYIPHRLDEGYGLHSAAVAALASSGTSLLITVDCGTTSAVEVSQAQAAGVDCIVTDHHETAGTLASAMAVVNPKLPRARYPWRHLSGVGVAYKLMSALGESLGQPDLVADLEDLVAFGTIADVVPLQDENRALVYRGLKKLNTSPLPGLAALAAISQCAPGTIEAHHVAFQMAPRLNAVGRMADAATGMEMLMAPTLETALPLGVQLDEANRARKEEEERILVQAQQAAEVLSENPVLVVAGSDWHPGVLGIVASRLVEMYGRPTLVLTREGDAVTGSGRSVPGFHITEALEANRHLLARYGGHAMAAGLSLSGAHLAELQKVLDEEARRQLGPDGRAPRLLDVDAWVEPDELDAALLGELNRLGPFGCGNPSPVLAWASVVPSEVRVVGKESRHLRLTLPMGRSQVTAVGFRLGHKAAEAAATSLDLAFALTINEWRGQRSLELRVRDLRPSEFGSCAEVAVASETDLGVRSEIPCIDARSARTECPAYVGSIARRNLRPVLWTWCQDMPAESEALVLFPGAPWATPPSSPWGLVLYDPPVAEDWIRVWSWLTAEAPPAEVHILYGAREAAKGRVLIDADWPARDGLAQAYLQLQRLQRAGQCLTPEAIAVGSGLSPSGALYALRVFAELDLVRQDGQSWVLMARPGDKLDLSWAVSYNECMVRRRAASELLTGRQPCSALAHWLRCESTYSG